MAPQPRGVVPQEHVTRIRAAIAAAETAETELRASVVDALKAGGSVREVAKVSGLSTNTIQRWGREGGWPTAEQKTAREEARRRNREWRGQVGLDEQADALGRVTDALDPDE